MTPTFGSHFYPKLYESASIFFQSKLARTQYDLYKILHSLQHGFRINAKINEIHAVLLTFLFFELGICYIAQPSLEFTVCRMSLQMLGL